jgi:hypothetical protein
MVSHELEQPMITEYDSINTYAMRSTMVGSTKTLNMYGGTWILNYNDLHIAIDTDKLQSGISRVTTRMMPSHSRYLPLMMKSLNKYRRNEKLEKILNV